MTLTTTKQKIQFLESLIGAAEFSNEDHAKLVEIIDIYKDGNEPLMDLASLVWLDKLVRKHNG